MRIRTVISGTVAAVICLLILSIQYYRIGPAAFVPGWSIITLSPAVLNALPPVIWVICAVTLFAFGWVAARWNWSKTWQSSLNAGAGAGVLAGCLIYDFIGLFWSGIQAHAEILKVFYSPVTEAAGTKLLVESLIKTQSLIYSNFVWCMLACITMGALGGLASSIDLNDDWGMSPRNPQGWLFRLPAYILVVLGVVNLIINIAVMELLAPKIQNTIVQMDAKYGIVLENSFDRADFLYFNYLVGWLFVIVPVGLIVGWFIRLYRQGGSLTLSSMTGLAIMVSLLLVGIWFVAPEMFLGRPIAPSALALGLGIASALAVWVGCMTRDESEGFPYRSSDWVGYLLGYGILGGTQIMMGAPAYSLCTSLIGIMNIPHIVQGGVVDKNPVSQVTSLFSIQASIGVGLIFGSILLALLVVNAVSFFRSLLDVRETYPQHEA